MKTKRKRDKSRKKIWIALLVILGFSVILAVAVYQGPPKLKKAAAEYFEIINPTVDIGEFVGGNGTYENCTGVKISQISFTIRAVGGDAHSLTVKGWVAEPLGIEVILRGESEYATLYSDTPYLSRKGSNGKFPLPISIVSVEAEGTITIDL